MVHSEVIEVKPVNHEITFFKYVLVIILAQCVFMAPLYQNMFSTQLSLLEHIYLLPISLLWSAILVTFLYVVIATKNVSAALIHKTAIKFMIGLFVLNLATYGFLFAGNPKIL